MRDLNKLAKQAQPSRRGQAGVAKPVLSLQPEGPEREDDGNQGTPEIEERNGGKAGVVGNAGWGAGE